MFAFIVEYVKIINILICTALFFRGEFFNDWENRCGEDKGRGVLVFSK